MFTNRLFALSSLSFQFTGNLFFSLKWTNMDLLEMSADILEKIIDEKKQSLVISKSFFFFWGGGLFSIFFS